MITDLIINNVNEEFSLRLTKLMRIKNENQR